MNGPKLTHVIKYADISGAPVQYSDFEAWCFVNGAWERVHLAEVFHKSKTLTAAQYAAIYPDLPKLPFTAFQEGGNSFATPS